MSYQEKKTIATIATGVTVLLAYATYAFMTYKTGGPKVNDLSSWATAMLVFMAIGIVIAIVTQIALHIGIVAGYGLKRDLR